MRQRRCRRSVCTVDSEERASAAGVTGSSLSGTAGRLAAPLRGRREDGRLKRLSRRCAAFTKLHQSSDAALSGSTDEPPSAPLPCRLAPCLLLCRQLRVIRKHKSRPPLPQQRVCCRCSNGVAVRQVVPSCGDNKACRQYHPGPVRYGRHSQALVLHPGTGSQQCDGW